MTAPNRPGRSEKRDDRWGFARLTRRADFQRVGKGSRYHQPSLSMQVSAQPGEGAEAVAGSARIGLTITRKIGNAVERNRIRRRLRAALAETAGIESRPGHDYVVVARREALAVPFDALRAELARAFERIHEQRGRDQRRGARKPSSPASPADTVTR